MPSTIGKCKLFRIKHVTLLVGETFLRNQHEIAFFDIKYTFFGRKENTISLLINRRQAPNTDILFTEASDIGFIKRGDIYSLRSTLPKVRKD